MDVTLCVLAEFGRLSNLRRPRGWSAVGAVRAGGVAAAGEAVGRRALISVQRLSRSRSTADGSRPAIFCENVHQRPSESPCIGARRAACPWALARCPRTADYDRLNFLRAFVADSAPPARLPARSRMSAYTVSSVSVRSEVMTISGAERLHGESFNSRPAANSMPSTFAEVQRSSRDSIEAKLPHNGHFGSRGDRVRPRTRVE